MLICSRLLGLLVISTISTCAAAKTADTAPFPFANESLPTAAPNPEPSRATVDAIKATPVAETGAPVVESRKVTFAQCSSEVHLQKSVLVMAFPQRNPTDANAGDLYQVEHQLPQFLSQQLALKRSTIEPQYINQALAVNTGGSQTQLEMQVQRLGRSYRSQIIVSGEILDMAMAQPEATYNPSLYRRFVNGTLDLVGMGRSFDKRERMFSFQVYLRDGFTGQQLFSKRYDTYGIWKPSKRVGFGTPQFWQSDYGQQVKGLVKMASDELNEVINCQPFIAQIDSRPGQTQVILQGGANNGLHAGDTLALYQLVIQGSQSHYQEHDVRLVNRNAAIELREVYPSHSVGIVEGTSYLNGQFLAMAP